MFCCSTPTFPTRGACQPGGTLRARQRHAAGALRRRHGSRWAASARDVHHAVVVEGHLLTTGF